MACTTVVISSNSSEQIFAGNLMKAPPLNRRGRKKWRDRYFVLRSNKTLECYKSKRAADSFKAPRRVIDLRECINLEVGLEYKNLSHIMSLGTFKRTFFMAAPSDALMLQWGNVLEQTKSAREGSSIEVLDIGLRRSRDPKLVHGIKPSQAAMQFSKKDAAPHSNSKHPKSDIGLTGYMRQSSDLQMASQSSESPDASLVSDRESQSSSSVVFTPLKEGDGGDNFQALGSPYSWAEGSQDGKYSTGYTRNFRKLPLESETSESSTSTTSSSLGTPQEARHSLAATPQTSQTSQTSQQALRRHPRRVLIIPNKVPPPPNVAAKRSGLAFDSSGEQTDYVNLGAMETLEDAPSNKEFIAKEGALQRGVKVIKGSKVKGASNAKRRNKRQAKINTTPAPTESSLTPVDENSGLEGSGATILHSNMKRSFRYRKITLRPEKPLFGESAHADNSSDEETETGNETAPVLHSKTLEPKSRAKAGPVTISDEHIQKLGPNFGINPSPTATRRYETLSTSRPSKFLKTKANSYSKITVGRRLEQMAKLSSGKLEPILTRSLEAEPLNPPVRFTLFPADEALRMSMVSGPVPLSPEWDTLKLPARFPSDPYLYASMSSLDNIVVDPPEMFTTEGSGKANQEKSKPVAELEQKAKSNDSTKAPVSTHTNSRSKDMKGLNSGSHDKKQALGPPPHADVLTISGAMVTDRSSTESCDTGYTSASPGYGGNNNSTSGYHDNKGEKSHDAHSGHPSQLHLKHTLPTEEAYDHRSVTPPLGFEASHVMQRQASVGSCSSSDSIRREYVPLVFHSDPVAGDDQGSFSLQICLVENSEELIKDLIALKQLERYKVLECEEVQGNSMAAFGDDFTVATALEDLEFGFSIVQSSQKDIFQRKVREFSFELKDLFGCSAKPFSCDVEIRHGNQIIILPIEIERSSC